jgi:hypothetical protein
MTTSVRTHRSSRHEGGRRFASTVENAQQQQQQHRRSMDGVLGLATLLLSALAAAVMVVADQLMDSMAEAHLLLLWMVLWATAFAALVLFAGAARMAATRMKAGVDGWSRSRAGRPLRAIAGADARGRNDLQAGVAAASDAETYCDVVKPQLRTMNARAKRLARFS